MIMCLILEECLSYQMAISSLFRKSAGKANLMLLGMISSQIQLAAKKTKYVV